MNPSDKYFPKDPSFKSFLADSSAEALRRESLAIRALTFFDKIQDSCTTDLPPPAKGLLAAMFGLNRFPDINRRVWPTELSFLSRALMLGGLLSTAPPYESYVDQETGLSCVSLFMKISESDGSLAGSNRTSEQRKSALLCAVIPRPENLVDAPITENDLELAVPAFAIPLARDDGDWQVYSFRLEPSTTDDPNTPSMNLFVEPLDHATAENILDTEVARFLDNPN